MNSAPILPWKKQYCNFFPSVGYGKIGTVLCNVRVPNARRKFLLKKEECHDFQQPSIYVRFFAIGADRILSGAPKISKSGFVYI